MTVFARLAPIIAERLNLEDRVIEPTDTLIDDLGADDLFKVEIALAVEDEFDIGITDADLDGLVTVADVVALIERLDPTTKET